MLGDLEPRTPVAQIVDSTKPNKLAHVVLRTKNLDAMTRWYLTVLNARLALGTPAISFLAFDEEHHRIAIAQVDTTTARDPNQPGMDHIAFTYAGLGELLKTYQRLRGEDILPRWCINHGVTTSLYYVDPDGNRVELQIDNFATEEELQYFFENDPEFIKNPLGAPFEPDRLINDYDAGVPMSQLLKVPPYPPGLSPADVRKDMGFP